VLVESALVAVQLASGVSLPWDGWSEKVWDETWSRAEQRCPAQMQDFLAARPDFRELMFKEFIGPKWVDFNMATSDLLIGEASQFSWRDATGFVIVAAVQAGSAIKYMSYLRSGEIDDATKTGADLWRIAKADLEAAKCLDLPESAYDALLATFWTRKLGEQMVDLREKLACTDWFGATERLLAIPPEDAMASGMTERVEVAMGSVKTKCGRGLN
jgi:hypothetical protein